MRLRSFAILGLVAAAFGCPANDDGGNADAADGGTAVTPTSSADAGDTMSTTGMPGGSGSADGATTGGMVTTTMPGGDAADSPPVYFDLGMLPDAPMNEMQCTKVDFMFVIDNSGSMSSYQAQLVSNFPNFIGGIQDSLEDVSSYHVGVITTDAYTYNIAGCNNLSSLVVQTGGGSSSNAVCGPYADGDNFMTENDDLANTFSCAAQVGTSGSGTEFPMQAIVEATQEVDGGPGQCNEGFLRDDALLVIVIITDEADGPIDPKTHSPGDAMSWYDDVVAARGGIPENIVVMSFVNYMGGPCPPGSGYDDGQDIVDFTMMFGKNGFVAGICEADWGPLFQQGIAVIDNACENYIPPG